MNINIGDYRIESDSICFILKAKRIVKETKKTKEENIGEERWVAIGYYTNIDKVLEAIPRQVLLDNDDLKEIIRKLNTISIKIGGIKLALEGVVKSE